MEPEKLASYLDATLLKWGTSRKDIEKFAEEQLQWPVASLVVYPQDLPWIVPLLQGKPTLACTVVGFPHGRSPQCAKEEEIRWAANQGCDEIDMVIATGRWLSGEVEAVQKELNALCQLCRDLKMTSKVIVETAVLQPEHEVMLPEICQKAGADFIKTSTGFEKAGAKLETIQLWKSQNRPLRIKAAGGVKTYEDALRFIEAGADRIGTSGAAAILSGATHQGY